MALEEPGPPPPQHAAPQDPPRTSEPEPANPVRLPEFDLELHLRGGGDAAEMRTKLVESKGVQTKDG